MKRIVQFIFGIIFLPLELYTMLLFIPFCLIFSVVAWFSSEHDDIIMWRKAIFRPLDSWKWIRGLP
jgi:hypothetical protein